MLDVDNNLVDTESVAEVVEVQRGENTLVCRGRRKKDGLSVLVKSLPILPSSSDDALLREYERAVTLEGCPNLLKVTEYHPNYLVFEGVDGFVFLNTLLIHGPLSMSNLLQVAVHICDSLASIHKRMYIHNAINPSSILVNPLTSETKLFNLAYACKLKENRTQPVTILPGQDLAFVSPEQTGRYGKTPDFRSDLYSLGIVLYTMATGAPPFSSSSSDPLDLIHAHIAKPAPPVHTVNSAISIALSQVIHKLIEKAPENRYQSAIGARNDLVHCLHDIQVGRTRKSFELGTSDTIPAPQVSRTLFGRDEEQQKLKEILTRKSNNLAVVLVVGTTGSGKTSLIRSVMSYAPGLFASSKCYEESNRPHEGIIACVRSLLMQTMGQGDHHSFRKWKPRIVNLCGPNTAILVEMLPELAPLLGPPMPLEDLPPRERTIRFNMLLIGILKIIAEEYPICLFIDDLHNLDAGSLELITMLLTQCTSSNITFISAFREECLENSSHLISTTLPSIDQFKPTTIKLLPLSLECTERMLACALNIRPDSPTEFASPSSELRSLSQVIHAQTGGIPLFIVRFLAQLHQFGHIKWNWDSTGWEWDITRVSSMPFSVDSVQWASMAQTQRITPELQRMLQVAAVAGGPFASRSLLELAHLFLEESPATSESEHEDENSAGEDSGDESSSTGSISNELAHAKIVSPSPLRRSGPPSITPIPISDVSSSRTSTSPSRPHTPPNTRTHITTTSPTKATQALAIPPSIQPPKDSVQPFLGALEVPTTKQAELSRTPSQLDQLFQAYPHDGFTRRPKAPTLNPPNTATSIHVPNVTSPTSVRTSITSPTSPSISPTILPRFSEPVLEVPSPSGKDGFSNRLRRMDSFPRVSSRDDVSQAKQKDDKDKIQSEFVRVGKLQRSLGTLPVPVSNSRRKSTDEFNNIGDFATPFFTITEIPTAINTSTPTTPVTTATPTTPITTTPTPSTPAPTTTTSTPTTPLSDTNAAAGMQSPEEPDDSAWANFPRVYRGEERENEGAMFHVTSRRLRSMSGIRKVGSGENVRNKKYAAIVDMLINEAVTCSLLKVSQEQIVGSNDRDVLISFSHEKIRQSILSQVSNRFARQIHLEYGNILLHAGGPELYTAITHLNAAKKLIVSVDARANLRRLNYRVGSTAKSSGAHESALKYLKTGYELVRPEEWKSDYAAVFALSLAYAECEFLSGTRADAMKLFEGLLVKAESLGDRARCYSNLVKALVSCGEYTEAVRIACECCRYLGWDINPSPTHDEAMAYAKRIEKEMENKTLEELLNLKQTSDERIIYLLGMLLTMFDSTYFINVDLFCVISCKMMELTLEYGNSTITTGGYSMFALAVLCLQMSPSFAYRVDQAAMALLEKYPSSTAVRVKAKILHTFAMYAKHHLRDTLPCYEEAIQSGMHAGDMAFTVYAMIHKANIFYRICSPLKDVLEHGYRVHDYVANKAKFQDMALLLAGMLYPACAISGDANYKPLLTAKDLAYLFSKERTSTANLTTLGWALSSIMEGKYLEEKYDDAFEAGSLSQTVKASQKGSLGMVQLQFYHSLSALAKFDSSHDPKLLDVVRENQVFMGWWAENCHINGRHKYLLVQAELARVTGDAQGAMKLYEQVITHAHQHGFLNVEALGYELYAKHLLAQGYNVLASNSFSKAIEVYSTWGAMVKVDLLNSKYGNLVDSFLLRGAVVDPLPRQQRLADLDMMIVVRSLQMLSQGLESHGLLERFVSLVVQSACAEKGAVVLRSQAIAANVLSSLSSLHASQNNLAPTGDMKVAVFWDVRKTEKPTVMNVRVPISDCDLPLDIIQAVANTEQYVLVQNMQDSDFQAKNASRGTASVMCLPVFRKAHEVVGVMYLEHSSSNVFSRERLHMLELLCVQLGILLQNSSLYESMQESMQMYELLAESLPQMIFCHRTADHPEYTNKLAQSYLGLTLDQLKLVYKYNFNDTIHPNDFPDFVRAWNEAFGKSVTLTAEFRVKRASDSTYRWAMMRSVPVVDNRGLLVISVLSIDIKLVDREGGTLIVTTISDVDDEHRAKERQLRISRIEASEKRYRLLSEAIPHIIWTTTQNGAAIFFNSKWVEYTGISVEDSYGFGWYHAVHPDDLDNVRRAWANIGTDRLELEFRIRKWDGEYRWHLSRGIPCYEENSTNLVWFGTSTDINDNKVAAMVLTKAREAAEKAAANQALFLANMSHEIRTPLSGLTGMLDLLVDTPLNPEQHDYVDTMHHSAEGLLCIINDILDFSKIEAGKLQLQNEQFNPESAIEVVCEILSIMAVTKEIELVFLVHPGVPPLLHGDPLRLRQVLMNLVGNAIKFTDSGEVIVECSLIESHGDLATLLFTVQDTGCGMTPEDQKSLFNAFYQVDPSITRTHGGTGLGLAICKRLVDLFGGTISVQSAKGVGSTFSFSANFKIVESIPKSLSSSSRHKHTLHVLTVADTPIIRKVVRFYLQQSVDGYVVSNQDAFNIVQVKDILKKSPKTFQKFIVDVADDQLPEVISTIKAYIENPTSPTSSLSSSSSPSSTVPTSPSRSHSSNIVRTPSNLNLIITNSNNSSAGTGSPVTPTFAPPNPFAPPTPLTSSSSSSTSLSLAHHVPAIVVVTTPLKRSQYVKICADVLQGCQANLRTLIKPVTGTKLRVALATSPAELAAAQGVESVGVEEVDIAPPSPHAAPPPPVVKANKAPILIVEDNEVNQKVIRRHVEKWGLKCEVASNGAEAVRMVTQDRAPNYYCLALMDLFMPTVDGFEATRLIREWEHNRAPLSTSSSFSSPSPVSSSPPAFASSAPPLSSSPSSPAFAASSPPASSTRSSGRFGSLITEDKKSGLSISKIITNKDENNNNNSINNNTINNTSNDEEPKQFKRHNSTNLARLPIVVLTANVVGDIQEKIFQCGADDMLSKPIDFQKLRALVVHYSFLSTSE